MYLAEWDKAMHNELETVTESHYLTDSVRD